MHQLLACLGAVDELAFTSIYPELIPDGAEQKGYAVSSMLYPVLKVIMTPLAAVLLDTIGVAWILISQSVLSLAAATIESFIRLDETERRQRTPYSLLMGFLGEILDYRWCVTLGGAIAMLASWLLIWGRRRDVRKVYEG